MKVVEKRAWANPEEVEKCVANFQEHMKKRKVKSVVIIAENEDGNIYTSSSKSEDRFKTAGGLLMVALELLGFAQRDNKS